MAERSNFWRVSCEIGQEAGGSEEDKPEDLAIQLLCMFSLTNSIYQKSILADLYKVQSWGITSCSAFQCHTMTGP